MATITGLTKARMLEIEAASVVDGDIVSGHLILTKHDGTTIDAGSVVGPQGPQGPVGPAGFSAIPGEIRLWPGSALPDLAKYGHWVWADGAVYVIATYPEAAANIAAAWRTFAGASDPGALNFRVPDLRGLVPAGLDAMPGGARANRMTRAVAITIAAKTGEETHVISIPEMAQHAHGVNDGGHAHNTAITSAYNGVGITGWPAGRGFTLEWGKEAGSVPDGLVVYDHGSDVRGTGISLQNTGNNNGHETVQPTVMIPYIVKLDG